MPDPPPGGPTARPHRRAGTLRLAGFGGLLACYAAVLVFLRGRPTTNGDGGIFLSVAAALRHGYTLYSGVWDNKPPLFYYGGALGYAVLGWRGIYLLDVVWLTLAGVGMALYLTRLGARRTTVVVGTLAYPLMLTGVWYYAGYSELPAMAVLPVVAWLWVRGNPVITGLVLGVMVFERPDYAVLFAAVLVTPVVVRSLWGRQLAVACVRCAGGLLAGVLATGDVVAARGELGGYRSTLVGDLGYPSRVLAFQGEPGGVVGHLKVAGGFLVDDPTRGVAAILSAALLAGVVVAVLKRVRVRDMPVTPPERRLAVAVAVAFVGTLVVLAMGALWRHGMQVVAYPAAIGVALGVEVVASRVRSQAMAIAGAVGIVIVIGLGFGGLGVTAPSIGGSPESGWALSQWWRPTKSPTAEALNVAAGGRPTTYARLGTAMDQGHMAFIDPNLRLVCPIFAQYMFDAHWPSVVDCITRRAPELLVVDKQFMRQATAPDNATTPYITDQARRYMRTLKTWVEDHYWPVLQRHARGGGLVVWRRAGTTPLR